MDMLLNLIIALVIFFIIIWALFYCIDAIFSVLGTPSNITTTSPQPIGLYVPVIVPTLLKVAVVICDLYWLLSHYDYHFIR